ncbi:hypothetical protein F5I97DRAFT_624667 [Phlebopus sp. FC_14]|nr:hypothetical protein F5I97DRAFT_624667 [Phlebopus sp. FC_14]
MDARNRTCRPDLSPWEQDRLRSSYSVGIDALYAAGCRGNVLSMYMFVLLDVTTSAADGNDLNIRILQGFSRSTRSIGTDAGSGAAGRGRTQKMSIWNIHTREFKCTAFWNVEESGGRGSVSGLSVYEDFSSESINETHSEGRQCHMAFFLSSYMHKHIRTVAKVSLLSERDRGRERGSCQTKSVTVTMTAPRWTPAVQQSGQEHKMARCPWSPSFRPLHICIASACVLGVVQMPIKIRVCRTVNAIPRSHFDSSTGSSQQRFPHSGLILPHFADFPYVAQSRPLYSSSSRAGRTSVIMHAKTCV